jgi:hypothetical protein
MNELAERQRRRIRERRYARKGGGGEVVLIDKGERKHKALIDALSRPFDELVRRVTAQMRSRRQSS